VKRLLGLLLLLEQAGRRFGLAQRRVDIAREPLSLGEQQPRVPFEGPLARPLLVLEKVEGTSACEKWWTRSG
jgi:hypothetical protein